MQSVVAEEDVGVEGDDLTLAVYGVSRVSVPCSAVLVSIVGCDNARCPGHGFLLWYVHCPGVKVNPM